MMKQKLNCVLLIDDNPANNFLHNRVITKAGIAQKVVAVESAQQALDYLTSQEDGEHPQPDLVFLDLNMPMMNGWEFLEEHGKLNKEQQGKVILIMLTTSLMPSDEEKANRIPQIHGFKRKPLTPEMLQDILKQHFVDRL